MRFLVTYRVTKKISTADFNFQAIIEAADLASAKKKAEDPSLPFKKNGCDFIYTVISVSPQA